MGGKKFANLIKSCKSWLEKVMFPASHKCIFCGNELYKDDGVYSTCNECFAELPFRMGQYCIYCGDAGVSGDICKRCMELRPDFSALYAPFHYSGAVTKVVVNYKDVPHKWLAKYIAKFMADWYNTFHFAGEVITYVPSSADAIKYRGFDHNKNVCEELGKLIDMPVVSTLSCSSKMKKQKSQSREMRELNVLGHFGVPKELDISTIEGKDIILVDDVVTTGATVRECSRLLIKYGKAKSVRVLAFARR